MFKTALVPIVGVVVLALMFGCVRDVKTESAADFSLASGQTWDWVPDKVEAWQDYKRGARDARINVKDAYAEERQETREERAERREEPVSPERRADRREEVYEPITDTVRAVGDPGAGDEAREGVYDPITDTVRAVGDPGAGDEARALKREHKHIQESIEGELSSKGIQRLEGEIPTYFVAYYLFAGAEPIAPREYAAYEGRTEWGDDWDNYAEDSLVIDIVDPSSGQLLWSGSGVGNTRGMGDESDRMRGVKEAVRHIMRDLE